MSGGRCDGSRCGGTCPPRNEGKFESLADQCGGLIADVVGLIHGNRRFFNHLNLRVRRLEDVAAFEFVAEFLLAGEDEAVFGREELLALAEDGVADEGVVLVGAEEFIPAMMWDVVQDIRIQPQRVFGVPNNRHWPWA